jgi:hypothetical protein
LQQKLFSLHNDTARNGTACEIDTPAGVNDVQ